MPAARTPKKAPPALPVFDRTGIIGQLLKALQASGKSLSELAALTGVNSAQLSRFMRGERSLSLPVAARVCVKLKLTLSGALLDGKKK